MILDVIVALLVSAWIEITDQNIFKNFGKVALLVSAWIEIAPPNIFPPSAPLSHSL